MGHNYSYPILTLDPEPYNRTLGGPNPFKPLRPDLSGKRSHGSRRRGVPRRPRRISGRGRLDAASSHLWGCRCLGFTLSQLGRCLGFRFVTEPSTLQDCFCERGQGCLDEEDLGIGFEGLGFRAS